MLRHLLVVGLVALAGAGAKSLRPEERVPREVPSENGKAGATLEKSEVNPLASVLRSEQCVHFCAIS